MLREKRDAIVNAIDGVRFSARDQDLIARILSCYEEGFVFLCDYETAIKPPNDSIGVVAYSIPKQILEKIGYGLVMYDRDGDDCLDRDDIGYAIRNQIYDDEPIYLHLALTYEEMTSEFLDLVEVIVPKGVDIEHITKMMNIEANINLTKVRIDEAIDKGDKEGFARLVGKLRGLTQIRVGHVNSVTKIYGKTTELRRG